mgnify:CR=1 FL=1
MPQADATSEIQRALSERIFVLDGAMGTTIRTYGLNEADARGSRFADNDKDLLNNGDILSITRPEVIGDIHKRFYEAGSDICETNTFSATGIAQSEFFVEDPREKGGRKDPEFFQKILEDNFLNDLAWEMNVESSRLCRKWADDIGTDTGRKRYVAGAIGPLTVCSDPGARNSKRLPVKANGLVRLRSPGSVGRTGRVSAPIIMVPLSFDDVAAQLLPLLIPLPARGSSAAAAAAPTASASSSRVPLRVAVDEPCCGIGGTRSAVRYLNSRKRARPTENDFVVVSALDADERRDKTKLYNATAWQTADTKCDIECD